MILATRAIQDPASFIYAAAKRHPQDLERISKIRDPWAQANEMGRLEERMRVAKPGTKAPNPLSKTQEESSYRQEKRREIGDSIDDLIFNAEEKKKALIRARSGRR